MRAASIRLDGWIVTTLEEVRSGVLVGRAIVELTFRIAYSRGEVVFFTNMERVKNRWRSAKISEKHQVTIPIAEMRIAGLEAGERVIARADGPGRVVLEREEDVLESFSGSLTGVFDHGILEQLRNEWD